MGRKSEEGKQAAVATLKRSPLKRGKPLAPIGKTQKKCEICHKRFIKSRPVQPVCNNIKCALEYVKRKQVAAKVAPIIKKPSRNTKEKRAFLDNDRSHQLKLTQTVVNRYVRWRDRGKGCMTCGKPPHSASKHLTGSDRDAGHYLTRAAYSALRFDIRQIYAQCTTCNRFNSGRRHEFRLAMIELHGIEFVEWLESQTQPKKWDIDELKAIRKKYNTLLRDELREVGDEG